MPYVERVTKAGNTIEIERYFTSRYKKKGISRGDKVKPTKEEQEKVNTRQAERKLRILINANYGYGDYHLVLDYIRRKGEPDRTPEQMRQDIDVFLRECRKEYRKAGLEFKYIHVMEIGKKGARHHHLVVNKIDTEILQRCWYKAYEGHNRVKVFPLDDSGNYAELASYLIKYTGTHKKGTDGALQGKDCKRCCLRCRYYDICRWDVLGNAGLQSEETITLLAIENSKPHKDGLLFRICQYVEFKQRARRGNEKL